MRKLFVLFASMACLLGCNLPPHDPGALVLLVESPEEHGIEGLEYITIDVERVEVILRDDPDDESTERRIDLDAEPATVSLLGLERRAPRVLGVYYVEPGYLSQIRFVTTHGVMGISGEEIEPQLPSYPETGLKAVAHEPIKIRDERYTYVKIIFDPDQQIETPPGQGYLLKPTIPAERLQDQGIGGFVPNEVIYRLEPGFAHGDLAELLEETNGDLIESLPDLGVLRFPEGSDVEAILDMLNEHDAISSAAEHAFGVPFRTAPNDPVFSSQWNLERISAPAAWDITTGARATLVGVLDCGFLSADDILPNLIINEGEIPRTMAFPPVDADNDGVITILDLNLPLNAGVIGDCYTDGIIDSREVLFPFDSSHPDCHGLADGLDNDGIMLGPDVVSGPIETIDDIVGISLVGSHTGGINAGTGWPIGDTSGGDDCFGGFRQHGTHMASIIGAAGNNDFAISGVNWQTGLIPIKISESTSGIFHELDFAIALEYAAKRGITLLNLSLGVEGRPLKPSDQVAFWKDLVSSRLGTDALLIAAAGNLGQDCDQSKFVCLPAELDLDQVIGVGATDKNDKKSIANFGNSTIDIAAPGVDIYAADLFAPGYGITVGSSPATAHVTGVGALLLSADPSLTGDWAEVRRRILDGADPVVSPSNRIRGDRRVNAYGTLSIP